MESAIRFDSICLALVTFLPPVLTQLIWTKGVAMRSARGRSMSWQRRDVMFALSSAPSQRWVHQSFFFCLRKQNKFHASALFLRLVCRAVLPWLVSWLSFFCGFFPHSFRPTCSVCHLMSNFSFRGPGFNVELLSSGHGHAVFVPCEVQLEVAPVTERNLYSSMPPPSR